MWVGMRQERVRPGFPYLAGVVLAGVDLVAVAATPAKSRWCRLRTTLRISPSPAGVTAPRGKLSFPAIFGQTASARGLDAGYNRQAGSESGNRNATQGASVTLVAA